MKHRCSCGQEFLGWCSRPTNLHAIREQWDFFRAEVGRLQAEIQQMSKARHQLLPQTAIATDNPALHEHFRDLIEVAQGAAGIQDRCCALNEDCWHEKARRALKKVRGEAPYDKPSEAQKC